MIWTVRLRGPAMTAVGVLILTVGAALGWWSSRCDRRRRDAFAAELPLRPGAMSEWRLRFPEVPDDEVHEYLGLFTEAFLLPGDLRRHLRPDDCIRCIYVRLYPRNVSPCDELNCEAFGMWVEQRYGCRLSAAWTDETTLGDVLAEALAGLPRP